MDVDQRYMRRALELAQYGEGFTGSNPMVGAVIVGPDGRIIGEGWHRCYGRGHAEVNAVTSVDDKSLLPHSTIYVTLEPCSHYGKTPPCAKLLIDSGIRRVVVGAADPFPQVAGRGIAMLRDAGAEVVEGVMARESRRLNERFFTAHTLHRPFVTLKWARSADGWLDRIRDAREPATAFSTALTQKLSHQLRATHDAILIGAGTWIADRPSLTNRLWAGRQPRRIVLDPHGIADAPADWLTINQCMPLPELLNMLYRQGITSLLVEGGSSVLHSFIEAGMWDRIREEISPIRLGNNGAAQAPAINFARESEISVGPNRIVTYRNPDSAKTAGLD